MAPSLETSYRGHLPVAPTTPIRVVTDMLHHVHCRFKTANTRQLLGDSDEEIDDEPNTAPLHNPFDTPFRNTMTSLRTTKASFLVTSSPVLSTSQLPPVTSNLISPEKPRNVQLLELEPLTEMERHLQAALHEANKWNSVQRKQMVAMQSALVLNGVYCNLVRGQLAAQEESRKKKAKGRLVGDGLPRLLSSREFVTRVIEFQADADRKARELKERQATRTEKSAVMKAWKKLDDDRKARNIEIRAEHQEDVKAWEEERDFAKEQKRRARWTKPVLKGKLFSPLPKPQFIVDPGEKAAEDEDNAESDEDDSDGDSDGDCD